jgi:type 1 fimbriae regulatory protein FimB
MEALSKPELIALLQAAKTHKTRDWLMILVAYSHGLRASEVIAITKDDLKGESLEIARLKGSNHTRQTLHVDKDPLLNERESLIAFARNLHGKQRLFPYTRKTFQRIVERHAKTAGLPSERRHPHMLKHTCGAEIYDKTKDLRLVRMRLGHKRESSSLIYSGRIAEKVADAQIDALLGSQ